MLSVFEFLNKYDLVYKGIPNFYTIDALSVKNILDVAEILSVLSESQLTPPAKDTFSHSASLALGGGRALCDVLEHRLQRVEELARFAVMYSDCVYIHNFFLDYFHPTSKSADELKIALTSDIEILLTIKPLLEKGFVRIYTPEGHSCPHCFDLAFRDTENRVERGFRRVSREYLLNMSASVIHLDRRLCKFECNGPEPYFDHPVILGNDAKNRRFHNYLRSKPRVLSKLKREGSVLLSPTSIKQLGLHRYFARTVAKSVSFGLFTSGLKKTSYLTDSALELMFLQSVTNDPELEYRNSIALKHLTSIVPFVADVPVSKLIKLRKREEDAFIQYRRALNEAIAEFKARGPFLNEREARTLYSDVIAPRLTSLDRRVSIAKRDLVRKASRSVLAVAGAITFGIYTGLIPTELTEAAKALGLTKVVADILEKSLPLGEAVSGVKNDDLYFLWKVRRYTKEA